MKPKLLLLLLFPCLLCRAQRLSVYFKTGSADVPDSAIVALKAFAEKYNSCRYSFFIEGLSDGVGKEEDNDRLSSQRAEAVQQVLQSSGWQRPVRTQGSGEKEAIAGGDTGPNQSYRRVDITVVNELCESRPEGNIADLYKRLQDKGQEFCINPDHDTALVGANGTIVYYKKGTFQNTANCPCLKLVLHEFYKKADLILNNLTTTTDDQPLESGGMMKLEGFCGADTLRYGPGKFLTVMVPSDTLLPGMKILSARRNDAGEILNWQADKDFPQTDGIDWNRAHMICGTQGFFGAVGCPFFFCQVGNFFKGGGLNKKQKALKKLIDSLNAEAGLLEKYELDEKKLGGALLRSKEANKDVLKYYVYKNATWDYHNIDRYMKGTKFVDYTVAEPYSVEKDVKLVYTRTKAVLPSFQKAGLYRFTNVFEKQDIYIIGLRYTDGQAYLSLAKENTSSGESKLNFTPVTPEELKTTLQRIN